MAIPKSVTPSRIEENADTGGFELTPADMGAIAGLDRGHRGRMVVPRKEDGSLRDAAHKHYPFYGEF